ncbi:hypothetical protein ACIBCB_16820 [Streptomyces uncialis]|uniref:hypothetical protein n=1 Tax=Streptomyces uncialis TaxID=1048205 RepID=UPI0037B84BDA|nr:hypothetical protein OG924_34170 [Streptomyces uncialis]
MPISRDTDLTSSDPGGAAPPPALPQRLRRWAVTARDQAAVSALTEEAGLLGRDDIRLVLVREDAATGLRCDWSALARQLYVLELSAAERVFLGFVLSMAGSHQTALSRVQELDEARLAIVLRALVRLSGNGRIAVGTRV